MAITEVDFEKVLSDFTGHASHQQRVIVGVRSCLRVLPDIARIIETKRDPVSPEAQEQTFLTAFRMALLLTVYGSSQDEEFKNHVRNANVVHNEKSLGPLLDLADCLDLALSGNSETDALTKLVSGNSYLAVERLEALRRDVGLLLRVSPGAALSDPLWNNTPRKTQEQLSALWEFTEKSGSQDRFRFWRAWYDGFLTGEPLDWDLQERVALIPDEDWKKGAAHIADVIAGIEAEFVEARTPYAVTVQIAADGRSLESTAAAMGNAALYQTALKRVRYTMNKMRPEGVLPQHYVFASPIFERLDDAFATFSGDKQWMHDEFLLSARQMGGLAAANEIPKDDLVDALTTAMINGADDIRAADEVVKA